VAGKTDGWLNESPQSAVAECCSIPLLQRGNRSTLKTIMITTHSSRSARMAPGGASVPCARTSVGSNWRWAALVIALLLGLEDDASAAPIIQNFFPTGYGTAGPAGGWTSGSVPKDSYDGAWKVAAWAQGGTFQPTYTPASGTSPTPYAPYDAYVFQSAQLPPTQSPPYSIPDTWLGGSSNQGFAGALWIGLQNSSIGIINEPTSTFVGDFKSSMVLQTTFVATETGVALLDFWASADNAVAFFVGGTITTATNVVDSGTFAQNVGPDNKPWQQYAIGTNFPTITGGQQVGFGRNFAVLTHYTSYANVVAGTNTFYAVVYDSVVGTDNHTGLLLTPVPEPSSFVLAGIAVGCIALSHRRSQRRRRLRQSVAGRDADGQPVGDAAPGASDVAG
jgi:hypothetical protein